MQVRPGASPSSSARPTCTACWTLPSMRTWCCSWWTARLALRWRLLSSSTCCRCARGCCCALLCESGKQRQRAGCRGALPSFFSLLPSPTPSLRCAMAPPVLRVLSAPHVRLAAGMLQACVPAPVRARSSSPACPSLAAARGCKAAHRWQQCVAASLPSLGSSVWLRGRAQMAAMCGCKPALPWQQRMAARPRTDGSNVWLRACPPLAAAYGCEAAHRWPLCTPGFHAGQSGTRPATCGLVCGLLTQRVCKH